ncbi:MAG: Gfo/Idh/MocA family oxidoreductase [Bryobacterales bacterium]|nr:Gfo/Idh/MocA family oxidoreductase [Bryobacterales bacterium]
MNRRLFLTSTALSASRIMGANDRVNVGLIGAGGRGRYLTGDFKELGANVNAVCDIYEPNLQEGLKVASTGAKSFDNYKRLLDDKGVDAVIVATPDHWHAQMTIDAVHAGKDVYVEKPMAHTIDEGFRMIDATRKTKRIVQVGTQRRSSELFMAGKKVIDSGVCGEVRLVNSWWYNNTSKPRPFELKGKLDWNQWLGSAPKRALDPMRFRNWYWFFDYSGGLLVGQAAHVVDAILWYMNSKYPIKVTCTGGKPQISEFEVPETATITWEAPENYFGVFTLGYKAMRYALYNDQKKEFHGDKARFDVGREWWMVYPESNALEMKPSQENKQPGSFKFAGISHIRNFLECVRSRKEPNAPVEAGQATNIVLCMAMDSLRQGRTLKWNNATRKVEV